MRQRGCVDTPQSRQYHRRNLYGGLPGRALNSTDLDIDQLRESLAGRLVGSRLLYYEKLDSTMDEARRLANTGEVEGAVVIAEEQTAGRGRFSREWISPPGENLLFSVLLRPTTEQLRFVNMAATLAVCLTVESETGAVAGIKWPNDVRVGGLKISGILIETAIERQDVQHAIVGIGINVNTDLERHPQIASLATSIYRVSGRRADRTAVLTKTLQRLDDLYASIRDGGSLTGQWASRLDTLGKRVRVQWGDSVVEGKAVDVDPNGDLVVARPDGSRAVMPAGEVTLQE